MSRFQRVQQWQTFSKTWYVFDAKWQNPFRSARIITSYLEGKNKPIYSPGVDCGDHVVVINSRNISLLGREWKYRAYMHHPGYFKKHPGGGAKWIPAWELHSRDPTLVLWKACYSNLNGGLGRRFTMAQLHVYADGFDTIPTEIANSISSQIQPPDKIPKGLDEYSEEEIKDFPKLWDYPKDYRPV